MSTFLCTQKVSTPWNRSVCPAVYLITPEETVFSTLIFSAQHCYPNISVEFKFQPKTFRISYLPIHFTLFSVGFHEIWPMRYKNLVTQENALFEVFWYGELESKCFSVRNSVRGSLHRCLPTSGVKRTSNFNSSGKHISRDFSASGTRIRGRIDHEQHRLGVTWPFSTSGVKKNIEISFSLKICP